MVVNIHERLIPASPEAVGALLDTLGSSNDRLWPLPPRDQMVLRQDGRRGLAVGAAGGHGPVRYAVAEYVPGERVVFRFTPGLPLTGTHSLSVTAAPGGALIRHVLDTRAHHVMRVLGPLVVRSMHDCYVEDAFDRAERELGVGPAREHDHSRWVRLLEPKLRRRVSECARADGPLAREALPTIDAADAFRTDIVTGDGTDPIAWITAVFAAVPWWVRALMRARHVLMRPFGVVVDDADSAAMFPVHAVTDTEAVLGMDDKHLDFRVIATIDETAGSVTVTTVVHVHSVVGRLYWGVVRHIHPHVVRSLMRHTAYPAGHLAPFALRHAATVGAPSRAAG